MQSKPAEKPDIFGYFDYRMYLKALFNFHKSRSAAFSHRYIVKKAGFKSPNALKNVIDGKRNLTSITAKQFAAAFQLDPGESLYFMAMVQFTQSKLPEERDGLFLKLTAMQEQQDPDKLSENRLEILSQWWHLAVREIISLPDFGSSPKWIADCLVPSITPQQAAESLSLLKRKGFIAKAEKGWKSVEPILATEPDVNSSLALRFHREMMGLAADSLVRFRGTEREVSGTTLRLGMDDVDTIRKLLREFRKKVLNIAVRSKTPDQVYQLNFQLFPLARTHRAHGMDRARARE
ncbi:MAG: TIGR02147 family protein [Fibrobacterota bacterium]|nr:TIGR02147 family protein [Fibrobacterota bacterium]